MGRGGAADRDRNARTHPAHGPGAGSRRLLAEQRRDVAGPFEIVLGHATAPTKARDQVGPLADAGATWWDERQLQSSEDVH